MSVISPTRLRPAGLPQAAAGLRAPRIGLALVGAAQAEVGIWGELSPHRFYESFPGFGHHWVRMLGPYNEHLTRDYAAAELGFAVLLALAALWFTRSLVLGAGAAFVVGTVPHFMYHLTTTGSMSTTDNVASLGSFVLELAVVATIAAGAARASGDPAPARPTRA